MKKLSAVMMASALALSAAAQAPVKGETVGELGIGVGALSGGGSTAMFTQRVAVEYGLADLNLDGHAWCLTLGAQVSNGVRTSSMDIPGLFSTSATRDDITLMPYVGLHHGFTERLEGYVSLGMGLGLLTARVSVDGESDSATDAAFAMALNLGARYWFSPSWAVNTQIGIPSAIWKDGTASYNIFSVGISYKF